MTTGLVKRWNALNGVGPSTTGEYVTFTDYQTAYAAGEVAGKAGADRVAEACEKLARRCEAQARLLVAYRTGGVAKDSAVDAMYATEGADVEARAALAEYKPKPPLPPDYQERLRRLA